MEYLRRLRWAMALRGIAAIAFGILAYAWPGVTLIVLLALFGVYALVDGVLALVGSIAHARETRDWWLVAIGGIFSILIGIITFTRPGLTALVLLLLIAAKAVFSGVMEIASAIRWWRRVRGEWLMALSGIISIVFGVLVFVYPFEGALAVIWLIALYAIIYGIVELAFASYARRWEHAMGLERGEAPPAMPA